MFFDKKKIVDAVDKATRKVLAKFGAFVRQAAKSSIRTRKRISQPGQPPSSHAGTLKRLIFFGYDADRRSVVIGPMPFRKAEAPALLEQDHVAGTTRTVVRTVKSKRGGTQRRRMVYRARPFMGPAFEKEKATLPKRWANSVKP